MYAKFPSMSSHSAVIPINLGISSPQDFKIFCRGLVFLYLADLLLHQSLILKNHYQI